VAPRRDCCDERTDVVVVLEDIIVAWRWRLQTDSPACFGTVDNLLEVGLAFRLFFFGKQHWCWWWYTILFHPSSTKAVTVGNNIGSSSSIQTLVRT